MHLNQPGKGCPASRCEHPCRMPGQTKRTPLPQRETASAGVYTGSLEGVLASDSGPRTSDNGAAMGSDGSETGVSADDTALVIFGETALHSLVGSNVTT